MKFQLIFLGLVFPALLAADTKSEWKEFSSKDGGFSVLLPGKPVEQTKKVPSPAGEIEIKLFVVEKGKELSYLVAFNDMPPEAIKKGGEEDLLNGARDGAVASSKGQIKNEKKIKLGEYPGREILFEVPETAFGRLRIYTVKNRLYQVLVVGKTQDMVQTKDTDRYLESFKLSQKKVNPKSKK